MRTQLQEKEKEVQLLKERMMHHKEDHKKVEDDVQTMKKEKIDPKTVQISPTVSNCYPIHNYLKSMF